MPGTMAAIPVQGLSYLENTLLHHGSGDLLEAGDIGAGYQIIAEAVFFGSLHRDLVDVMHNAFELLIHFLFGPGQALGILAHLQGGDGHAAA